MTPITSFYPMIRPHVCGAPDSRIQTEVLNTLQDVLTSTHIWREWSPTISDNDGTEDVVITHPEGRRALSVLRVKCGGVDITENLDGEALANMAGGLIAGLEIECYSAIDVLVSYTITEDATEIPDNIWHRYRQIILDGAKARLFSQIKRPWGEQALVALHAKQYNHGLAKIKGDVAQGYSSINARNRSYKMRGMP